MKELSTDIEIKAPASAVWGILTSFNRYHEWNPFIKEAEGRLKEGEQLKVRIKPPGSKGMTFKPTIIRLVPDRTFRWLGRLLIPGIFDGEHIFEIEPIADNIVQFTHREKFRGFLVPILWNKMESNTRKGFTEMNLALKRKAEELQRNT